MKRNQPGERDEVISYRKLRTFIGLTGISLPFVLVLGCYLSGDGQYSWQPSISDYYYSKMHIVFVGLLSVLGAFLLTYKGKAASESRWSNFAGACAFAVAAFPTGVKDFRSNGQNQYLELCKKVSSFMNGVHYFSAFLLLLCFVVFCLYYFQFADGDYNTAEEKQKFKRRKLLYRICGFGIIASLVMIFLFTFIFPQTGGLFIYTTLIFETTALLCFGTAWLVKGSAMWVYTPVMQSLVKPIRQVPHTE